jgi:hypothetical protein
MYLSEQLNAVQKWHTIVGDHRIERPLLQFNQSRSTVARRDHRVSRMIQQCLQKKPRMMVVIHNENSFAGAVHRAPPICVDAEDRLRVEWPLSPLRATHAQRHEPSY